MVTRSALALAAALLVPAEAFGAAELVPHRATFTLSLQQGAPSPGILGVIGRMAVEFEVACDGYITRHALQMLVRDSLGETTESHYTATLWESFDGREMTFATASTFGTIADPSYAGRAASGTNGAAAGRVTYDVPGGSLSLRHGTVFPSQHTQQLIDAARDGQHIVSHQLFGGGSPQSYTFVSTSIGEAQISDSPLLTGRKSWTMREAHFRPGGLPEMPEFEIGFRQYEGGMIDNLDLDYGVFRVAGRLSALEMLSPPRC